MDIVIATPARRRKHLAGIFEWREGRAPSPAELDWMAGMSETARVMFDERAWSHRTEPETIYLFQADETDAARILSHESLHVTLYRLGEWDASYQLDRLWVLHRLEARSV